jgi:hypothetical protein
MQALWVHRGTQVAIEHTCFGALSVFERGFFLKRHALFSLTMIDFFKIKAISLDLDDTCGPFGPPSVAPRKS